MQSDQHNITYIYFSTNLTKTCDKTEKIQHPVTRLYQINGGL